MFNDASGWYGKTHDAAKIKVDQELDHGREIRNVLNRISDDAEDAARTLKHAKEFTLQDVDAAVSEGFTVTDTGEVSHPDAKKAQAPPTISVGFSPGSTSSRASMTCTARS